MALDFIYHSLQVFWAGWLTTLAVVVLLKTFQKQNGLGSMIAAPGRSQADPERIALLMITLGVALYYLIHTISLPLTALETSDGYSLPDIPDEFLILLAGSQTAYVSGKSLR